MCACDKGRKGGSITGGEGEGVRRGEGAMRKLVGGWVCVEGGEREEKRGTSFLRAVRASGLCPRWSVTHARARASPHPTAPPTHEESLGRVIKNGL